MFSFKLIEPKKTPVDLKRQLAIEARQKEFSNLLDRGIRERVVFNAHEKTTQTARKASIRAGDEVEKLNNKIIDCRASQDKFFTARRLIKEAAQKVANEHNIDLHEIDPDSDEDRSVFFFTASTSGSNWNSTMRGSFEHSPSNSQTNLVRKHSRSPRDLLFNNTSPFKHQPFYSSVNKNFTQS